MLPVQQTLSAEQRKLLALFSGLQSTQQEQLLAFAAFLSQSAEVVTAETVAETTQPLAIERPAEETVIAAMRRLTATFHTLDTTPLLDQASLLMSSHLLQGKAAVDVIDQLQDLFEQAHAKAIAD